MNIDQIKDKILKTEHYINGWEDMKRAAVIIPIIEINGTVNIIFEVRSKKLNKQPGDVCFPGGKIDEGETPKAAALREINEELKITNDNIKIINELDTFIRHDGIIVHPFLGLIDNNIKISINQSEVDHYFYVPIEYLINNKPSEFINKIKVERGEDFPYDLIANGKNYKFVDGRSKVIFYKYKDYVIWGLTATILQNFLRKIL